MKAFRRIFIALIFVALGSCNVAYSGSTPKHSITVTSSAYNSVRSQTHGNPSVGAWGDKLRPGMRVIAVSRDLIRKGLKHNTKVKIEGLPGFYLVKDKMGKRWSRKIDIYMGTDVKAARKWGKRKVKISW